MRVRDVMIPMVASIGPEATLREAAEKIRALGIDPMPVTEDGKVTGQLSLDVLAEVAKREGLATGTRRVQDDMLPVPIVLGAEWDIGEALSRIESHRSSDRSAWWPVTAHDQTLVGVVSTHELRNQSGEESAGVTAVGDVNSVDDLVEPHDDRVDYAIDSTFPASDPTPPPTTLSPDSQDERSNKDL